MRTPQASNKPMSTTFTKALTTMHETSTKRTAIRSTFDSLKSSGIAKRLANSSM
jgi:hypothetical protein